MEARPSLAAMGQSRRFYLSSARSGEGYRLSEQKPVDNAFITQTVDLAERTDIDRVSPSSGFIDKKLDDWNSVVYTSDPLPEPVELSGLFSGRLDLVANKKDLDFYIGLYELTPDGEYFPLSSHLARASYVADRTRRHLLTPGRRVQLDFKSGRLTSRRFRAGSRLVVLLGLIRQPELQINYGTGNDVSDETIADAKEPLRVKWFGEGFIEVPIRRR